MKDTVHIYTDGAAKGNPGKAGWGVVCLLGNKVHEIGGRADHATNNQMELTAAIEGLKHLRKNKFENAEVFSDSKYVILGITEWIHGWIKNGWRNAAKKPVVNKELWEELHELNTAMKPKWTYVKGHADNEHNNRADIIATTYAEGEPVELKK